MENILSAEKEVLLRTSLDEMMFAKTKFSSLMYEKGYIAESDWTAAKKVNWTARPAPAGEKMRIFLSGEI